MTDGGWEFRVLGPVTARYDGRAVETGPRRRRATLAALLMDAGRTVPADVLIDRVWDTHVPDKPHAGLHAHVSRLRSAMRTAAGGAEPPLRTEPAGYRLEAEPSTVDDLRYAGHLRRARELRADRRIAAARAEVGSGLELWRGAPYEDVPVAFAEAEAGRLSDLLRDGRLLVAELDLDLGDHRSALDGLEELASADPWHEPVQAALLLALYRCGRRSDAVRRYGRLRATIADELGVEPGPELRELHERMLRADPVLDPPRCRTPVPAPAAPPTGSTEPAGPAGPAGPRMVGRDAELDRVRTRVRTAWSAAVPATVAVVGEAGIGKTRLLDEATGVLAGAVVARGRCWEHGGTPPLWPWIQVVREVAAAVPDVAGAVLADRAAALHAIVAGLPGAPCDGTTRDAGPVALFDALTALLGAVAADRPVLVVLEDLHWADPASREMTEYLALHATAGRLAVLASVRVPDHDPGPGAELLAALARTGRSERVTLSGLTADDVAAYVTGRTGRMPDGDTARALTERTGGNPFFVGELVRLPVDGSGPDPDSDAVPDGVREVIRHRVGRMDPADRRLLQSASVLGRTFDLELLEAVCDLDPAGVDESVDRATAAGFLCAEPGRDGEHRFTHALVAEAVLAEVGPGARRRLHEHAAAALRARAGTDPLRHADRVLHHLARAGGQDRLDAAVELALTVADARLDRKNYVGAEAVLRDAEDMVGRLTGPGAEQRELSVLTRLNSLYDSYRGPAFSDDRPSRSRALELARRLSSDRDLTAALAASFATAFGVADLDHGDTVVDELRRAGELGGSVAMRTIAHHLRGHSAIQRGQFRRAVDEFSAAIDAFDEVDPRSWSSVLSAPLESAYPFRAAALGMLGRHREAAADRAVTLAGTRSDDLFVAGWSSGSLALSTMLAVRPAETAEHAGRCVEWAGRVGAHAVVTYNRVHLYWGRERCEPGRWLDDLRAALAELDAPPNLLMRPMLHGVFGDVLLRAGEVDEARAVLDRALAETGRTGNHLFGPQLRHLRAGVADRDGDHAAAVAGHAAAQRLARRQGIAPGVPLRWDVPGVPTAPVAVR